MTIRSDDHDLAPPPDPDQLTNFPRRTLAKGRLIYRLHHKGLSPFWFGSTPADAGGGDRFDLAPPRGSSYWAMSPVVAVLETLVRRPITMIPTEQLQRYSFTSVALPRRLSDVANLPVKPARRFGLTAEIHATTDRGLTRLWARALDRAGCPGVIALPRHDVTGRQRSLTLFGVAGEHEPWGWRWKPTIGPLPSAVASELAGWGIRVVPIPFDVETITPVAGK